MQQAALRDLMAGVSRRDADAVAQAVLQVASLRRGVDVNDFERALARFMAQHLAPGSRADAAMFNAMLRLFFELRHHAARRVEHVLPRADRARGHAHHDRARTTR